MREAFQEGSTFLLGIIQIGETPLPKSILTFLKVKKVAKIGLHVGWGVGGGGWGGQRNGCFFLGRIP